MNDVIQPDQDLIPVFEGEIGGVKTLVVDARSLHEHLNIGKDFTNWVKKRISEYGFHEDVDFLVRQNGRFKDDKEGRDLLMSEISEPIIGRGGDRRSVTYTLTLDMAKELAMVERNEMGRLARRYFIQCETELKQKQLETHKETQATDELEDNQLSTLFQFMRSRVSYWSLKKRDLIYQPGMDHDTLFSILEDIQYSTYEELFKQFRKKFPMAYQSIYFSDMRKFINEWTPHFFRNKQTSKVGHANV